MRRKWTRFYVTLVLTAPGPHAVLSAQIEGVSAEKAKAEQRLEGVTDKLKEAIEKLLGQSSLRIGLVL